MNEEFSVTYSDVALIVADAHVEHSSSGNQREGQLTLFGLDKIDELVRKVMPKTVLLLGDTFDSDTIASSLAIRVKKLILYWSTELKIQVIFLLGNHEYERLTSSFYGQSTVSAIFHPSDAHLNNISIIDEHPRLVRMHSGPVFLGLPYRHDFDQFEENIATWLCFASERLKDHEGFRGFKDEISEDYFKELVGRVSPDNALRFEKELREVNVQPSDEILIGWHVGLPIGDAAHRGEEPVNGWIIGDHPLVKALFRLSSQKVILGGHYHVPNMTEIPEAGGCLIYVGSPSSRTVAESSQDKRVILHAGGGRHVRDVLRPEGFHEDLSFDTHGFSFLAKISTNLIFDKIVASHIEAEAFVRDMVSRFGEGVASNLKCVIKLPTGSSIDDYNVAKIYAAKLPGKIEVVKLPSRLNEKIAAIHEQSYDETINYSANARDLDILRLAARDTYRGMAFTFLSDEEFKLLTKLNYEDVTKVYAPFADHFGTDFTSKTKWTDGSNSLSLDEARAARVELLSKIRGVFYELGEEKEREIYEAFESLSPLAIASIGRYLRVAVKIEVVASNISV
ncbi:MAG: hypothetical protein EOP06_02685 [Proteobacteria bacterium]|nr:MAG: hypothetical protein EOP06_02685 [Pseudomonadota bacterium]